MSYKVKYVFESIGYGGYATIGDSGVLMSGFETYEEAEAYVDWARENLRHDSYEILPE